MMDCTPQIHMVAIHSEPGYRTFVPGVGLVCEKDDYLVMGGQYSNSVGRMSAYASFGKYLTEYQSVRVGVMAGAASGYGNVGMGIVPLAGLVLTKPTSWGALNALVVPKVEGLTPSFVQFNISFKLPR